MGENGFKDTAVGEIPFAWTLSPLGNLLAIELRNGIYKPRQSYGTGNVSIIQLNDIYSNNGQIEASRLDTVAIDENEKSSYEILGGDFVINRVSKRQEGVGAIALAGKIDRPVVFESNMFRVRLDTTRISNGYFYYFGQSDIYRTQAINNATKGNQTSINQGALKSVRVPLPPLPEQRAIAHILSSVRQAIEATQRVIEAAQALKRSLMRHLFTYGPVRVEEAGGVRLKETEVGEVAEGWEVVQLKTIADVVYGIQAAVANLKDPTSGLPILTNVNITLDGRIDISELRYYPVSCDDRDRLILQKGDILFNWRSGSQRHVGKTAIFDKEGEYTFSSFILRFRVRTPAVDNHYLANYLHHLRASGYFMQNRSQSSVNSVFNKSASELIPVIIPSKAEQIAIAQSLAAAEIKIQIEIQRKAALEELFQALLHGLMTGKVRSTNVERINE